VETVNSLLERFSRLEGTLQTQKSCLMVELENLVSLNSPTFVQTVIHITCLQAEVQNLYKSYVNFGIAFGAKGWVAPLVRQFEHFVNAKAMNIPHVCICVLSQGRG